MTLVRQLMICGAACLAIASAASPGIGTAASAPIVEAPAGAMQGSAEGALHVFKGIPYAQPPIGPARWRPPAALARWAGVRDATQFGPACMQPIARGTGIYVEDLGAM